MTLKCNSLKKGFIYKFSYHLELNILETVKSRGWKSLITETFSDTFCCGKYMIYRSKQLYFSLGKYVQPTVHRAEGVGARVQFALPLWGRVEFLNECSEFRNSGEGLSSKVVQDSSLTALAINGYAYAFTLCSCLLRMTMFL